MLHKTRGIVISFVKFRETSIIVKIYTENFGVQSYIENGVRSAKGKNKIALFQALTFLDLVVYHDEKKEIHRISEIKCSNPFLTIPYDIYKSSIALFLNEILGKSLKEHSKNEALFEFLMHSINYLDQQNENFENFHLFFLISYCSYLGFSPENAEEIFNQLMTHAIKIDNEPRLTLLINELINSSFGQKITISRTERTQILETLLIFYQLHIEDFGEIKSITVLKEVLH